MDHQPDTKKLKMSTTTSNSDNDEQQTTLNPNPTTTLIKYKRRKIAIFFAYCGVNYQGMQKNPGAKTIEADLEQALYVSGAVPEADRGCPKRFDWARSARTDKGVSAVGQVVSGRFYVDPPGLVERLNDVLPKQIRIFGFKRVVPSFNAKKFCDRRRYVYLIPVFALDPSSHPDRESVLASLGSGKELAKCLECSERGRKVEGVMGKRVYEPKDVQIVVTACSDISSKRKSAEMESERREVRVVNGDANSVHHEVKGDVIDLDTPPDVGLGLENLTGNLSNSEAEMLDTMIEEKSGLVDNNNNNVNPERKGEVPVINGHANSDHHEVKGDIIELDTPPDVGLELETPTGILSNSGAEVSDTVIEQKSGLADNNVNPDSDQVKADILDSSVLENVGVGIGTEAGHMLNSPSAVLESGTDNGNVTYYPNIVKVDGMDTDIPENVCLGAGSEMGISLNNGSMLSCGEIGDIVSKEIDNCGLKFDQHNGNAVGTGVAVNEEKGEVKESGFRYGEEERERFNRILKMYVGTHNFHNFTTRIKAEDPSATRYIISFEANTVVNVDGIDFVKCEVVGQSFMLHQIRKMVGVAVAIMRNCADESLIETAFQRNVNITVPTAPEVGLYLDECFFSSYNEKWKDTHEEVSMKDYADEAEEFKMKHIYSHIASSEQKEGSVAIWLHSLNYRNYPDLRVGSNGGSSEGKEDEPK